MTVEHRCGFIISVPDRDGCDRETFRNRVVDHLRQLTGASICVPAFGVIVEKTNGESGEQEQVRPTDDKTFGVQATLNGEWWTDAYKKQAILTSTMQRHYGLQVTPADVRYDRDLVTVRFTPYPTEEKR